MSSNDHGLVPGMITSLDSKHTTSGYQSWQAVNQLAGKSLSHIVTCMVFICLFLFIKLSVDPDIGDIDGKQVVVNKMFI